MKKRIYFQERISVIKFIRVRKYVECIIKLNENFNKHT